MCKSFVTDTLHTTLEAEGILDIIDYNFYPWGNAYFNTTKCGTSSYDKQVGMTCWEQQCGGESPDADCFQGTVLCQHGDDECKWNRYEACAVHLNKENTMTFVNFTYCIESARFPNVKHCANYANIDAEKLEDCFNGEMGDIANAEMAKATTNLSPSHLGTPWVLVDGVVLNDPSTLLSSICSAYKGVKPASCHQTGARARLITPDRKTGIDMKNFC